MRALRSSALRRVCGLTGALALPRALLRAATPRAGGGPQPAPTTSLAADSLPRDPAVRLGELPNGLHYYVRVHKNPAKRAFLYLVVNAGSVQEDDDQQGFAHFLEHMAFNGTKHFPRHELVSTLQLAGMRFGADVNAQTSFDETIYMLEVPTDEEKLLHHGLTMLEDWAGGGMLIDSAEVVAERGVVLGEWRMRLGDTLSRQVVAHVDSVLYGPDSRYGTRSPIGLPDSIATAQPGPIRRFYQDWYQPKLMAVIAVGDFDHAQMEREIKRRFGKIPAAKSPRPRVSPRLPSNSEPLVDVYLGPVQPRITMAWKQPIRLPDTKAAFRAQLIERLLLEMLQRRFQRLSQQPRRPFIATGFGHAALPARGSMVTVLDVVAWPTDSLERGLATALTELERTAQHGVPEAALVRQKATLLRRYERAAASHAAVLSQAYVDAYVQHYLQGGGALLSAVQELALARELLPTITSADLARAAGFWRGGVDRITLVQFPKYAHERIPTRAGIATLIDSVATLQLASDSTSVVPEGPLSTRPLARGKVVSERHHARAGITEWVLSNGARVLFKPTWSDPDQLLIRAVSPGGTALLPDTLFFSPGRMVAEMMTQSARLGTQDPFSLEDQLAARGVQELQVELTPTEEAIRIGGSPMDLETLFDLLHLQFIAPRLDTTALTAWKQTGSTGGFSIDDQLNALLAQGNPRLAPTSWMLMPLADTGRAMAVYRDRFGNAGDFTFIIVGAATAAQVKPLVERYVASLPSTGKREQSKDLGVFPWDRLTRTAQRALDVPKASTVLLFDGKFPTAPDEYLAERRRLEALAMVLQLRFTDILREQMGSTYGVAVNAWTVAVPQEHYRFTINFDAAPERIDGVLDTMFIILNAMRTSEATASELAKVEAIQRRVWEEALQDNRYWMNTIALYDRLKIPFERIVVPSSTPLSAADVHKAAERYLPMDAYIHLTVLPRDSTLSARRDSTLQSDSTVKRASAAQRETLKR
jgi:zinc protease